MWRRSPVFPWIWATAVALAFQPDPAMLRRMFEEALSRREKAYGDADARTAQAARDLGLFLCRGRDALSAHQAMANAVRIDEKTLGANAAQTLEDAAALASVSPPAEAEPLLRRAMESPDPVVAGPALTSLAEIRKAAGDRAGAAALLRRAVEKAESMDGKNGPTVALILKSLALVTPPAEAVPLLERALAIDRQQFGPQSAQSIGDARRLATLLRATGRSPEASRLEREFKLASAR
jgi:tetratricopeptide (TPR) repeat protein